MNERFHYFQEFGFRVLSWKSQPTLIESQPYPINLHHCLCLKLPTYHSFLGCVAYFDVPSHSIHSHMIEKSISIKLTCNGEKRHDKEEENGKTC